MNKKIIIGLAVIICLALGSLSVLTLLKIRANMDYKADITSTVKKGPKPFPGPKIAPDIASLDRRAKAASNHAQSWTDLGFAQLAKRQFPAAVTSFKKSLAIAPDQAAVWSALGEAYSYSVENDEQLMPPEARQAFMNAVARDSNDIRARYFLAMEKDLTGKHQEALRDWFTILRRVPAGSEPDERIRSTIRWSVKRDLASLNVALQEAVEAQPKAVAKPAASTR